MADLGGSGRGSNGGSRAGPGPVPVTQNPLQASTQPLRTPRDIMRRREERERKTAEAEAAAAAAALARRRSEEQRQPLSSSSRPSAAQVPFSASAQTGGHIRLPSGQIPPPTSAQPGRHDPATGRASLDAAYTYPGTTQQQPASAGALPSSSHIDPQMRPSGSQRPRPTSQSADQPRPVPPTAGSAQRIAQTQAGATAGAQQHARPGVAGPSSGARSRAVSGQSTQGSITNFPHAFERWETLSSHWEGLTSYWIHRLEQNTEEMRREPMLAQLSRQVTDLSAAGANLFHAVVELQRLRASSERKFSRWFYDTKNDQERQQEIGAEMAEALQLEREARADDNKELRRELEELHASHANSHKMGIEMRRELQISKEEARRAWEELGRREQEERDRTTALREGQPILIGGIQVLPTSGDSTSQTRAANAATSAAADHQLIQSASGLSLPSISSRPVTRDGSSAPPAMSGMPMTAYHSADQAQPSPTDTDPFVEHGRPFLSPPTTNGSMHLQHSPAMSAALSGSQESPFYRQTNAFIHSAPSNHPNQGAQRTPATAVSVAGAPASAPAHAAHSHPSQDTFSSEQDEEEYDYDDYGNVRRDEYGRPIMYRRGLIRSDEEDELDVAGELERERAHRAKYGPVLSAVNYPAIPAPSSSVITPTTLAQQHLPPAPVPASVPAAVPASVAEASSRAHTSSGSESPYATAPPADYEGGGFEEWDDQPVNYHPTRLSDVPEQDEDERSRISEMSARGLGPF